MSAMERLDRTAGHPVRGLRGEVRESQLFIGILGHCYGSRPPDDERSFTEIEYDTAVTEGLPRLMFVAPDAFPTAANVMRAESADDVKRQQAFRRRVLSADKAECSFHTAD